MTLRQTAQLEKTLSQWSLIVHDPRVEGRCKHRLIDILVIAFCATLCGAEGFVEIEAFGKSKQQWFKQYLEIPYGVPSHDTFRRVLSLVNPRQLEVILAQWAHHCLGDSRLKQIILDGKSIRGTNKAFNQGNMPLQLVSVFCPEQSVVLGQTQAGASGSAEVKSVVECLDALDIRGTLVTVDAGNSYPRVFAKVHEKRGHYLTPIKRNQRQLYASIDQFFKQVPKNGQDRRVLDHTEASETNRGRLEQRICSTASASHLKDPRLQEWYPGIRTIIRVIRTRELKDRRYMIQKTGSDGKQTYTSNPNLQKTRKQKEIVFYISDQGLSATRYLERIRNHWRIENTLHWSLDVAFGEDDCRVRERRAARNLATLRKIAFNIIKQDHQTPGSLAVKIKKAGWESSYLETLLLQLNF